MGDRVLARAAFRHPVKREDQLTTDAPKQAFTFCPQPIRSEHLSDDGFDRFCSAETSELKGRIRVTFLDRDGHREQWLDGGGPWEEFVFTLLEESFDPERGLWAKNEEQDLFPYPPIVAREAPQLKWYKFIRRMLGKVLYDNILYSQQVGQAGRLNPLASLDTYFHRSLVALKQWESDDCLDLDTCVDIVDIDLAQPITFTRRCSSDDQSRLPTAMTCFSTLKLPLYKSAHDMRDKLLQSITADAGFNLP
ncbi:hypothetical protein CALVIDRAFT_525307 [Calocera viscosa TUFC12733]|uniref:HECT-type E3 ubiquitin transferase n=1 Tax=Calocera viscosa (strain TUFC12733) TaxID=1330018 RepID=A0A167QHZ1_CALVF|nr:hypothetical protein CALVIDRAFT_525307 [Calocera viscosa TUFC12733]